MCEWIPCKPLAVRIDLLECPPASSKSPVQVIPGIHLVSLSHDPDTRCTGTIDRQYIRTSGRHYIRTSGRHLCTSVRQFICREKTRQTVFANSFIGGVRTSGTLPSGTEGRVSRCPSNDIHWIDEHGILYAIAFWPRIQLGAVCNGHLWWPLCLALYRLQHDPQWSITVEFCKDGCRWTVSIQIQHNEYHSNCRPTLRELFILVFGLQWIATFSERCSNSSSSSVTSVLRCSETVKYHVYLFVWMNSLTSHLLFELTYWSVLLLPVTHQSR